MLLYESIQTLASLRPELQGVCQRLLSIIYALSWCDDADDPDERDELYAQYRDGLRVLSKHLAICASSSGPIPDVGLTDTRWIICGVKPPEDKSGLLHCGEREKHKGPHAVWIQTGPRRWRKVYTWSDTMPQLAVNRE